MLSKKAVARHITGFVVGRSGEVELERAPWRPTTTLTSSRPPLNSINQDSDTSFVVLRDPIWFIVPIL